MVFEQAFMNIDDIFHSAFGVQFQISLRNSEDE